MKAIDIIKYIKADDIRGLLLKAEEELANEKAKAGGLAGVRRAVTKYLNQVVKTGLKENRPNIAGWFERNNKRYILDGYTGVEVVDGVDLSDDLKVDGIDINKLISSDMTYTKYNNVAELIKYLKDQTTLLKAERKLNKDLNSLYSICMGERYLDAPKLVTVLECLTLDDTIEIGVGYSGLMQLRNSNGNIGLIVNLKHADSKLADIDTTVFTNNRIN